MINPKTNTKTVVQRPNIEIVYNENINSPYFINIISITETTMPRSCIIIQAITIAIIIVNMRPPTNTIS